MREVEFGNCGVSGVE